MKNTLIGWLAAKGIPLANEASEQTILQAVEKAFTGAAAPVPALENEKETLSGQITALENEKTTLTARATALENERDAAKTAAKSAVAARVAATVDLAIGRGKLKVADRAARITALENSTALDADCAALLGQATVARVIGGQGAEAVKALANEMDTDNCRQTYAQAVVKHMKDTGETDPIKAHKAVMSAMPALSDAFKSKGEAESKK